MFALETKSQTSYRPENNDLLYIVVSMMGEYLSDFVHKVAFLANSSVYCQPTMEVSKGLHFKAALTTFCAHIRCNNGTESQ